MRDTVGLADIEAVRGLLAKGKNVILLHANADPDAVGSGVALHLFFGNSRLCAPAGVSRIGKNLLRATGIGLDEDFEQGEECTVVVDAHDEASLGFGGFDWEKAIVIDHHRLTGDCLAKTSFVDETASSCCELVWKIIGQPEKVDRNIGLALMSGIVSDTGRFKHATSDALASAADIMRASGVELEEVLELAGASDRHDMSQRISRLKGGQRLRFQRNGNWLVAVSEVGAFESAVCNGLLFLGADAGFVASVEKDNVRITGRASFKAVNAGLHLGEMLNSLAGEVGGEGGGHDGAAVLKATGDPEAMLNVCAQKALDSLKDMNG